MVNEYKARCRQLITTQVNQAVDREQAQCLVVLPKRVDDKTYEDVAKDLTEEFKLKGYNVSWSKAPNDNIIIKFIL